MLPFLPAKKQGSVVVHKVKEDGGLDVGIPEDEKDPGLMAMAEDLIRAVHAKDAAAVVDAMQCAFDMMETQPHQENEGE